MNNDLLNLDSLLGDCVTAPDYGDSAAPANKEQEQNVVQIEVGDITPDQNNNVNEEISHERESDTSEFLTAEVKRVVNDNQFNPTELLDRNDIKEEGAERHEAEGNADSLCLSSNNTAKNELQPLLSSVEFASLSDRNSIAINVVANALYSDDARKEISELIEMRPLESVLKDGYGLDSNYIALLTANTLEVSVVDSGNILETIVEDTALIKASLKEDGFIELREGGDVYKYYAWSPSGIEAARESYKSLENEFKDEKKKTGLIQICTVQAAVKLLGSHVGREWFKTIPRIEYPVVFSEFLKHRKDARILVEPAGSGSGINRISLWVMDSKIFSKLLPSELFDELPEAKNNQNSIENAIRFVLKNGGQVGSEVGPTFIDDISAIQVYTSLQDGALGYEGADGYFLKTDDSIFVDCFAKALLCRNGDERPIVHKESTIGVLVQRKGNVHHIQLKRSIEELEFTQNSRVIKTVSCKINRVEVMA